LLIFTLPKTRLSE